ncbi:MAG TPA: YcgN family cysteine cluster protein [Methylocella sp.]|nr:YcgN family cysteine cluster protein [Methylocella sp.]
MPQLSPRCLGASGVKAPRDKVNKAPDAKRRGEPEFALAPPFWKRKTLEALTASEWESLCDGCGRCCLVKLEDEDSGDIYFTDIACKLFDAGTCRCADYIHRRRKVRDCIRLTPNKVRSLKWLPPTCAYRLIAEGRDLAWWHPLVSGSTTSVHEAGVSVRGRIRASEKDVELDDYPKYIVDWPGKRPRTAKPRTGRGVRRRRATALMG